HNFIIPNSSFSWWGAWLADYKDKVVIVPKQWFADESINSDDLIPKEWIRI
ncbi:MAG: Alpha-1,2-fucosyltransferase, partial [Candidatus Nomurabacteria bacterium GW2011_GWE1_35_16]